jgi:hypothetical protein
VGEYIGNSDPTKGGDPSYLTVPKANQLIGDGLQIFSIYEHLGMDQPSYYTGIGTKSATNIGFKDGKAAYTAAMNDGQGSWVGSAIYVGAEPPVAATDTVLLTDIEDYFKGLWQGFVDAAKTLSNGVVLFTLGIYGYGAADDAVKSNDLATYSWLAGSQAAAEGYTNWNIRQVFNRATVGELLPFTSQAKYVASDITNGQYFGQWGANIPQASTTAALLGQYSASIVSGVETGSTSATGNLRTEEPPTFLGIKHVP